MGAAPTSPVELLAERRGGKKTSHKVKIGRKRFPQGGTDGELGNCGLVATVVFELLLFHHPPMLTQKRLLTFRSDRGQSGRLGPLRQGGAH